MRCDHGRWSFLWRFTSVGFWIEEDSLSVDFFKVSSDFGVCLTTVVSGVRGCWADNPKANPSMIVKNSTVLTIFFCVNIEKRALNTFIFVVNNFTIPEMSVENMAAIPRSQLTKSYRRLFSCLMFYN